MLYFVLPDNHHMEVFNGNRIYRRNHIARLGNMVYPYKQYLFMLYRVRALSCHKKYIVFATDLSEQGTSS